MYQIWSNTGRAFKQQSLKFIPLLPWLQYCHTNKLKNLLSLLECTCLPSMKVKYQSYEGKFLKIGRPKNMLTDLQGSDPRYSGKIVPFMLISSWTESKVFTLWKSRTDSEQLKRNKWQGQNRPRVKMSCCCLPPERLELTANSKKDINGRVKMSQKSRWAAVVHSLKKLK